MNVLFIGTVYPQERESEILTRFGFFDTPGNVLQWALLSGFDVYCKTDVVSIPTLGKCVKKINSSEFSHNNESADYCSGFINLPVFKEITSTSKAFKYIKSRVYNVIFIYSIGPSSLLLASLYKKKYPKAKIIQMITDLPVFMNSSSNRIYRFFKAIETRLDYCLMKNVDGFVLLAPAMYEQIPIGKKPWIQVEGIFDKKEENIEVKKAKEKVLLYTGNLDARYGMMDLLDAFGMTKDNAYRLWICGNGDTVPEIVKRQKIDNRIIYKGKVSHKEALCLQKEATLLVNPRHSTEVYTRFSFPSKTMEYIASGTPTLMSKLESLPDDYLTHLFLFEDESVLGMSRKIEEILSKPKDELQAFGEKASKFILDNKNPRQQVKRIVEFAERL